ncbi:IclR family transcriptional regulator [Candidatus Bipolaricaulota bacterium]|nr:IclR family transcriptional regulator [Candidatus Bipolaricaulota bacterium]
MSSLSTLEKGIRILTLFSNEAPALSAVEIADRLDLPASTAYRYLAVLRRHHLIVQERGGVYRLGTKILELAGCVIRPTLREIALPIMRTLSSQEGETVILSSLRDHEGVCLERIEGLHALRVSHQRGAVFPLHAGASGKALMAFLDSERQEEIIERFGLTRFTPNTITDSKKLRAELDRIRAQGYAQSNSEVDEGTYGIGAPILSRDGQVVASLCISAPTHRLEGKRQERVIRRIVNAAGRISEGLRASDVQ